VTAAFEQPLAPVRPWVTFAYDTRRWPFAAVLERDVFRVRPLAALHERLTAQRAAAGGRPVVTPHDNLALRELMQALPDDSAFYRLYHAFMLHVLAPLVGWPLSYSSHPKMRVHLPGTPTVSVFHADVPVTERPDQVNLWIPFTSVADTATLWLESGYGRGDHAPVPVRYGEVLVFDGGYLSHGSVPNTSTVTRVSLDLRFSIKGTKTREDGIRLMDRVAART
jgi:hypothetical protein